MPEFPASTPHQPEDHDPLAVPVGVWAGADAIPADGWPAQADPATIKRILSYAQEETEQ